MDTLEDQRFAVQTELEEQGYSRSQAKRMSHVLLPTLEQARSRASKAARGPAPSTSGGVAKRSAGQSQSNAMKHRWAKARELGFSTLAQLRDYERVTQ